VIEAFPLVCRLLGHDRLALLPGPAWMFDPAATAPFVVHTVAENVRPDVDPPLTFVAIDGRDGQLHHRSRAGVTALFQALGYPRDPGRLTAEQVLSAWLVIGEAARPSIVKNGSGARDPSVGRLIAPPRIHQEGETHITVGWTATWRGHVVKRHTLRVEPDGTIHAASEPASDVLHRPRT
jgi:hypothetical protein